VVAHVGVHDDHAVAARVLQAVQVRRAYRHNHTRTHTHDTTASVSAVAFAPPHGAHARATPARPRAHSGAAVPPPCAPWRGAASRAGAHRGRAFPGGGRARWCRFRTLWQALSQPPACRQGSRRPPRSPRTPDRCARVRPARQRSALEGMSDAREDHAEARSWNGAAQRAAVCVCAPFLELVDEEPDDNGQVLRLVVRGQDDGEKVGRRPRCHFARRGGGAARLLRARVCAVRAAPRARQGTHARGDERTAAQQRCAWRVGGSGGGRRDAAWEDGGGRE
jgi:hypothetical protein